MILKIHNLQREAEGAQPADKPKMNRSEFNHYLQMKSSQLQNDSPMMELTLDKTTKNDDQDDEDFDMESSGDKVTTVFPAPSSDPTSDLNDTTIVFDQEQED